ncbi:MAG: hypothetical protein EBZ79_02315 [Actinobacteria bacterium]|nr:hypothetical protein [Actinomycetota bacterium]
MESRPVIKSALSIWSSVNGAQVFIGSPYKSICLPSHWFGISTRLLLESFTGRLSLAQIGQQCALTASQLQALIDELQTHDLIDLERTAISYLKRYDPKAKAITPVADLEEFNEDLAAQSFIKRMEIESEAASLASGDIDGGRRSVVARRDFSILIFGYGRIVNSLVGALSASGFTKVLIINRLLQKSAALKILESDLSGGNISRGDIGQSRKEVLTRARSSSALFAEPTPFISRPKLIISVGPPKADEMQRWISEGSNHLIIEPHSSAEVRIGPYVIPGKSPCYHCLQISNQEQISSIERKEVGSALALGCAAIACLEVINLASSGLSHFLGKSMIYSNSNFHNPKIENWSINPGCGCSWR